MKFVSLITFSIFLNSANCLKIFGLFPLGSKSHFAIGKSIVDALYDVGHDITVLSPFPSKTPKERYRDINIFDLVEKQEEENKMVNPFEFGKLPIFGMIPFMANLGRDIVESIMEHAEVQKIMSSDEKFDICVIEIFYVESFMGMAEHFDCILIGYTTFNAVTIIDEITGNISPPSYVPMPFLDYTDKMTFIQRFWNTLYTEYDKAVFHILQYPLHERLYKNYFPNAKLPFKELLKSPAIIFQNSHVSTSTPRPYLPNVIEICGIHVKPANPLPSELQNFMDNADEGVIIFSMGSFIKSKDFPVEKRQALVNVFRKLKQKVIWKYEEDLPDKPNNLRIDSWLPQRDILGHKNIKLFITHGGLLGTTEAMYEGVPLLGIPIFGDQKMNMMNAVSKGYGLQVNFEDISEERIGAAIDKLLNDPKYFNTAKLLSKRFIDRPITPQQSVVYWTEFAHRHQGAQHLKGIGADLSYIQLYSIDVYAVLSIMLIVTIIVDFYIVRFLLRKLICKFSGKQKKN